MFDQSADLVSGWDRSMRPDAAGFSRSAEDASTTLRINGELKVFELTAQVRDVVDSGSKRLTDHRIDGGFLVVYEAPFPGNPRFALVFGDDGKVFAIRSMDEFTNSGGVRTQLFLRDGLAIIAALAKLKNIVAPIREDVHERLETRLTEAA